MSYESDLAAYKVQPTGEERRLMDMTSDQRRDYIDRMEHAAAQAEYQKKEADLQRRVDEATALSVSRNTQLNFGGLSIGRVSGDKTTFEHSNGPIRHNAVDMSNIPVTIGGIQLGPEQARELVAQGMFSQAEYQEALKAEAAKRGGVPSFRQPR